MSLALMIQVIFSDILLRYSDNCVVIIANQKNEVQSDESVQVALQNINFDNENISMYVFDDAVHFKKIKPSDRCLNYLIYHSDTVGTFETLEKYMHNDSYSRYNSRKYFFITHSMEKVNNIYASYLVRSIPNLVVALIKFVNKQFECVEFYYQAHLGSNISILDRWYFKDEVLIKQNDVNLYPEKIANSANGTIFRIGAGFMIPYTDPYQKTGIYWEFTKLYASRLNLTVVTHKTRTLVPDMFKMLDNGSLDFGFGIFSIV